MISSGIRRHLRANVVGYVALFVALSGTAYASHPGGANTINSADVINDSLTTLDLRDNAAVISEDVRDDTESFGGLRAEDIRQSAIGTSEIITGGVTESDIASSAVFTDEIAENTILANDIATNGVGGDEIGTGAVGTSEIADNTVAQADIATNGVASDEITAGGVGSSEVATEALNLTDIDGANTFILHDPPSIPASSCSEDTEVVSAVDVGDMLIAAPVSSIATGLITFPLTAVNDNQFDFTICNITNSAINDATRTYRLNSIDPG